MKKIADFQLTPRAKQVIMSFIKRRADSCKYLETDGKVLHGKWMGGRRIAYWKDDKIIIHEPDSRSKQTIIHAIEKLVPKSKIASIKKETNMNKYQQILADFLGDEQDIIEQEIALDPSPEESNDVVDLDGAIVNLFTGNASPEKQQVIDLAHQLDIDTETVEAAIYNMLSSFINKTEDSPDVEEVEEIDDCPDCMEASKYSKTLIEFLKDEKEMKKADKNKKWTLSEVKNALEDAGSHFFDRKTLKFFGQSMRDFGVTTVGNRVFIYSKRPGKHGVMTFHEFFPEKGRTLGVLGDFKNLSSIKDYLMNLKNGGKEEKACKESKYAKVLDDFLGEKKTATEQTDWGKVQQYHCPKCKWTGRIDSNVTEKVCPQCGKEGLREGPRQNRTKKNKGSKYAKVLDSFLKVSKKDKPRLSKYGEVYKKTSSDGKATIVVRGIFGRGKPDSYHVRVLRGKGEHGDDLDSPRKNVLYRDDVYLNPGETEKSILQKAIAIAEDWIKSEKWQKRLVKGASVKKTNKHAKVLDDFLGEEKIAITTEHFKVHIKWPKAFGEYGKSKVTDSKMDEYVNKLIGKTVESIKYPGLSFEIGPVVPGRTKKGIPVLSVNIYYNRKPGSNLPKDWSNKLINNLKEIKNIIRIK